MPELKKRTVVQRIRDAYEAERGVNLSATEVEMLWHDDALQTLCRNDDEDDEQQVGGRNGG